MRGGGRKGEEEGVMLRKGSNVDRLKDYFSQPRISVITFFLKKDALFRGIQNCRRK